MKHKLLFMMLVLILSGLHICRGQENQAADSPADKFIGIWNSQDKSWRAMKISYDQNNHVNIQIKYSDSNLIKSTSVAVYSDYLEFREAFNCEYGSWKVGNDNKVYKRDGRWEGYYVTGFNSKQNANKMVEYIAYRIVYKQEGNLELYHLYGSEFYTGNTLLFWSTTNWVFQADYTNW